VEVASTDLLDHAGRGHRPVEAGAGGDGALAHPGPAGQEEEDHEQREEELDRGVRRGGGDQVHHAVRRLDGNGARALAARTEFAEDVVGEALEAGVDVEQRLQRVADPADPFRQQPHPFGRGQHDRGDRDVGDGDEQQHADQADRPDGTRRRSNHSSRGTSAIAITEGGGDRQEEFGAGTQREGQCDGEADAGDQREGGEQPIAAEGDGLRFGERLLDPRLLAAVGLVRFARPDPLHPSVPEPAPALAEPRRLYQL
jgi:hypothetical protein